jgi:hypothetical protein
MIHIALGVFAGIVAAVWFLGWNAARIERKIARKQAAVRDRLLSTATYVPPQPYVPTEAEMRQTERWAAFAIIGVGLGTVAAIIHAMP